VQLLQGVHDLKGIVKQYICKGVISRALTATDAEKPKEIGEGKMAMFSRLFLVARRFKNA
jgi:hypothetical protein